MRRGTGASVHNIAGIVAANPAVNNPTLVKLAMVNKKMHAAVKDELTHRKLQKAVSRIHTARAEQYGQVHGSTLPHHIVEQHKRNGDNHYEERRNAKEKWSHPEWKHRIGDVYRYGQQYGAHWQAIIPFIDEDRFENNRNDLTGWMRARHRALKHHDPGYKEMYKHAKTGATRHGTNRPTSYIYPQTWAPHQTPPEFRPE